MPFNFSLNSKSGVPIYKQIVNYITYGISNGVLRPGEQLPTVRQLAVDLEVNLNTVIKAYNELEIKGLIHTQQGSGTFINESETKNTAHERENMIAGLCEAFINELSEKKITVSETLQILAQYAAKDQKTVSAISGGRHD